MVQSKAQQISESTLNVLRKLIAHQESASKIGSEAEAAAFAAKVQELLLKYNLEMADVGVDDDTHSGPLIGEDELKLTDLAVANTNGRWPYFWKLAGVVARAHFCRILLRSHSKAVVIIGESTNRKVAADMLLWLFVQMDALGATAWANRDKDAGHVDPWRFRVSFYHGFIDRIDVRYTDEKRKQEQVQSTAIVLRNHDQAIADYTSKAYPNMGRARGTSSQARSVEGYAAGSSAGSSVSIRGGNQVKGGNRRLLS